MSPLIKPLPVAVLTGLAVLTLTASPVQGQHRGMRMMGRPMMPMRPPMMMMPGMMHMTPRLMTPAMMTMMNTRTPFLAPQVFPTHQRNQFDSRLFRAYQRGLMRGNGYGMAGGYSGMSGGGGSTGGYGGGGSSGGGYGDGDSVVYISPYAAASLVGSDEPASPRRVFDDYLYGQGQLPGRLEGKPDVGPRPAGTPSR